MAVPAIKGATTPPTATTHTITLRTRRTTRRTRAIATTATPRPSSLISDDTAAAMDADMRDMCSWITAWALGSEYSVPPPPPPTDLSDPLSCQPSRATTATAAYTYKAVAQNPADARPGTVAVSSSREHVARAHDGDVSWRAGAGGSLGTRVVSVTAVLATAGAAGTDRG